MFKFPGKCLLRPLERIVHFYSDLDINIEGIETITHLLAKTESLQDELNMLRNHLRLYE